MRQAVGGGCQSGYCRLQMPLRLALAVRETVAWHRLGALEGGGYLPNASLPAPALYRVRHPAEGTQDTWRAHAAGRVSGFTVTET